MFCIPKRQSLTFKILPKIGKYGVSGHPVDACTCIYISIYKSKRLHGPHVCADWRLEISNCSASVTAVSKYLTFRSAQSPGYHKPTNMWEIAVTVRVRWPLYKMRHRRENLKMQFDASELLFYFDRCKAHPEQMPFCRWLIIQNLAVDHPSGNVPVTWLCCSSAILSKLHFL